MTTSNQSLSLRVSADSWQGDPQFIVTVDGQQIGGVQTATASHAAGQWQDVTLSGNFGADPSKVQVTFVNDAWGGNAATDRNLYVQSLTLNGKTYQGSALPNTLGPAMPDCAALYSGGTVAFAVQGASAVNPVVVTAAPIITAPATPIAGTVTQTLPGTATGTGTGAQNTLTLRVSADSWQGDPQFIVTVDGQQIGGVQTATASHAAGQWQDVTLSGNFGADPSKVQVTFVNDAWGGNAATDRNLYVQSLTLNGKTYQGSALPNTLGPAMPDCAALYSGGTVAFGTAAQNTLTLRVAADSWQGDPQFIVTVDGQQIGGVQTATASHAKGQWQDVTLSGNFGTDPSKVQVTFVNDAWGGNAATDRNLYVQSLTLNGKTYQGSSLPNTLGPAAPDCAVMDSGGTVSFPVQGASAVKPVVVPAAPTINAFASPVVGTAEPTVSGTAVPGSKVSLFVDGGTTAWATTVADASGAWLYTPTSALADGLHSFTASDTDAAGNTSARSAAQGLTIDTTPPSERVTSLLVADDNVVNSTEAAGSSLHVTGTLSAPLVAGDTISVTLGGTAYTLAGASVQGTSFALDAAKPASGWMAGTATAKISDAIGNAGTVLSQSYSVSSSGLSLLGVNLSGGEYSADKLPGVVGTNYTYPTHGEVDYYASKGMNVIRLPFLWERLQPTMNGPLSQPELAQIDDVVNYANSKGMKVILDPHNYGKGYGSLVGSAATPDSAFADFWGKMAGHYASNPNVMFGLMNEPQQSHASDWLGAANAAVSAIRGAGATSQEVLVPGTYWDGASSWTTSDNASVLGQGFKDPANNFAFEVHQYFDADGSGTSTNVASPTVGSSRLAAITQWAKSTGNKLFLGEFGNGQDAASLAVENDTLNFMSQHSDVWQGATDWAAGPWLGDNIFTIEPTGLGTGHVTDKPQMGVLQHYAPKHA